VPIEEEEEEVIGLYKFDYQCVLMVIFGDFRKVKKGPSYF
jgi:hypothetical protein